MNSLLTQYLAAEHVKDMHADAAQARRARAALSARHARKNKAHKAHAAGSLPRPCPDLGARSA